MLAKLTGLLGLDDGLPFELYRTAGFNYEGHLHVSGFPVREQPENNYSGTKSPPRSRADLMLLEVLEPVRPRESWGLRGLLGADDACFLAFMASLLELDPRKRVSASQALQHEFIHSSLY